MRFWLSLAIAVLVHILMLSLNSKTTSKVPQDHRTAIAFELVEVRQERPSDNIVEREENKPVPLVIEEPEGRKTPFPKAQPKRTPPKKPTNPQPEGLQNTDLASQESGDPYSQTDKVEPDLNRPGQHTHVSQEIKVDRPKVFHPPRYDHNPEPTYPEIAKRRGIQGRVLLEVLVDTNGTVKRVSLKESSGSRILDEAALEAVKRWIFTPATEDGSPVEALVEIPILFRLR